ncbi:hypothetical protein AV654_19730 [Paenibacillus elgii]|uniref:Uncharacterized protein n=1 Tax=Paenibacillus elgii TaxID=189691 RepID=A0A163XP52_9BACL|nr:hypothetical protein [Paenibacillus elgii]KZE78208.1 hypothetical protein AV654_19730 [Paenibacillus elgii]
MVIDGIDYPEFIWVSYPKVLRSPAGYYIGRTAKYEEDDAEVPFDRLSGYYRFEEDAEKALEG